MFSHKVFLLYSWFVWAATFFIPDMAITMRFRGFLYFLPLKKAGRNIQIANSARLLGLENISIGSHVYIASGVTVNARYPIEIKNEVMIGHNSVIVSGNHSRIGNSFRFGQSSGSKIVIGYGSWIGANCTVTAGSQIGQGVLVGANSLVRSSLMDDSLYAGVPVRLIKKLSCD